MNLFSFKKKKPSTIAAEETKKKRLDGDVFGKKRFSLKDKELSDGDSGIAKSREEKQSAKAVLVEDPHTYVLSNPRITEKATNLSERLVYTFDVVQNANKKEIARAVKGLYNVSPIAIRVVTVLGKKVRGQRGKIGVKSGGKKAYVYLKECDKIEIF